MGPEGRPPSARSFVEPIPVGVNESGELALLSLYSSSVLVGGVPGSGKSVGVEELLYGAALCPEVCLVVVDLKGGMELSAVDDAGRADYFVEHTAALASVLRRLMAEVIRRQRAVRAIPRLRKIEPDMWSEFPPLVLVIDELAEATASGDREADREINDLLRRLVALGRSTGLSVVASTQRPSSDLVPTSFRDLFRHRWGFRTSTAAMSAIVMGEANRDHPQGPHDIPDAMPGVSFIGDERGKRQRVRSFFITDEQIDTLAARAADVHRRSGWSFELPPDPKPPGVQSDGDDTSKRTKRPRRTRAD
jgi:S-DNA-T family DNA segregation ATPase FtsK/SpoIIIE